MHRPASVSAAATRDLRFPPSPGSRYLAVFLLRVVSCVSVVSGVLALVVFFEEIAIFRAQQSTFSPVLSFFPFPLLYVWLLCLNLS